MSAAVLKFSVPRSGKTSAANARYITREAATHSDERSIRFHNLEELKGKDYRETRTNFIAYTEARLDEETTRTKRGAGEARTHYRAVLSFDQAESTSKAHELADKWLKENFKDCRAAVVLHHDTKNLHAHVWVDARQLNDKKLNLDNKKFKSLDESWAKIYSKQYGEHYLTDHLRKKEETRAAKREYKTSKAPNQAKYKTDYKAREARNYDKAGAGIHQRDPSNEIKILSEAKRELNNSIDGSERTKKEIHENSKNSERRIQETIEILQLRAEADSRASNLYGKSRELVKRIELDRQREPEPIIERTFERERERVREKVKE
jgi:hypothetical protein